MLHNVQIDARRLLSVFDGILHRTPSSDLSFRLFCTCGHINTFNRSKIRFFNVNLASEFESGLTFWKESTIFVKWIKNRLILHIVLIISGSRQNSDKLGGPGERAC